MERILHGWRTDIADIFKFIYKQIFQNVCKETFDYIYKMITKTLLFMIALLGAWFAPLHGALVFICILVTVDTATAVYAAYLRKAVTSNKAFQIVPKIIFYGLLCICGQALAYYVEPDIPWIKIALAGVAWIELKSIDENFAKIFGYSFINKVILAMGKLKNLQKRSED